VPRFHGTGDAVTGISCSDDRGAHVLLLSVDISNIAFIGALGR